MHANTDPIGEVRKAALARLAELETVLVAHGFSVEVEAKFWSITASHAADARGPRRSHRVQLAADGAEQLHWYRSQGDAADIERLCSGDAIAEVSEIIARALRPAAHQ